MEFSFCDIIGGWSFLNASFQLQSIDDDMNMTDLSHLIEARFVNSSFVTLTNQDFAGMAKLGDQYRLRYSICTVLSSCYNGEQIFKETNVSSLIYVSVIGSANRTVQANAPLLLTVDAFYLRNVGGQIIRERSNLRYHWSLERVDAIDNSSSRRRLVGHNLTSGWQTSTVWNAVRLPSQSLLPDSLYVISVVATNVNSKLNSSLEIVYVRVQRSDLVASIVPSASQQLLPEGSVLTLNASSSYDPDGSAVTLSYEWSCKSSNMTQIPGRLID
eukprot:scaffold5927_cov182-Ochromonas_danica.AAC.1